MIKAKIKDNVYNIPTKWSETTYQQYIDLKDANGENEIISALTSIPINIISQLELEEKNKLYLLLQFTKIKFVPDEFEKPEHLLVNGKKIPYVKDIKEKTFGQKIYFQDVVNNNTNDLNSILLDIVAIFSQPYIDELEFDINKIDKTKELLKEVFFVDLYSTAIGYLSQLKKIVEEEAKTLSVKPDNNQILAGVKMFERFGVMNTIKALANNDITKYAEIERLEYNTVYVHMQMNKVQKEFDENYRQVLEQQRKSK